MKVLTNELPSTEIGIMILVTVSIHRNYNTNNDGQLLFVFRIGFMPVLYSSYKLSVNET